MNEIIIVSYLIASVLFIIGLKMLGSPDSARKGNLIAAAGMLLAIVVTLLDPSTHNHVLILGAIAVGTVIGTIMALKVQMTAMPQMVSFFNGMGGACAALIGVMEYSHLQVENGDMMRGDVLAIVIGLVIGSVSFSGSIIAMGKLQGKIKDVKLSGIVNIVLMIIVLALGGYTLSLSTNDMNVLYILLGVSLAYGVLFVMPIGGADMPVVISLLNSFTGVAAACGGFLYDNQVMMTGGILVGAAGTILTVDMCKAMNRSLLNVIIGSFGSSAAGNAGAGGEEGTVREINHSDTAILLAYATKVVIVPGYGLAVAQAQHTVHELEKTLEEKGVEVKYAIHPVAGRMPGHMNVLLAEADVPYPMLFEMDEINPEFETTDVVIVIGANDVVNPSAKNDPSSPIYGMPILNVENSKNVIVMKRSMGKGYAGIENPLFFNDNTRMLFGDAKQSLQKLVNEVKAV